MDGANAVDSTVTSPRVAMSLHGARKKKGREIRWLLSGKLGRNTLRVRLNCRPH